MTTSPRMKAIPLVAALAFCGFSAPTLADPVKVVAAENAASPDPGGR